MKIYHEESGVIYDVSEEKNSSFKLHDSRSNKTYAFKESYAAIWFAIELIRQASLEFLSESDLQGIAKKAQLKPEHVTKNLINSLKKERITHTYYDQIFLKLLTSYRCDHQEVKVSNKTNFVIDHELVFMIRRAIGSRLTIPFVKI